MLRSLFSALRKRWRLFLRMVGVGLLIWLLLRIDIGALLAIMATADIGLIVLAAVLLIPLISLKALRWQILMGNRMEWLFFFEATLSYFSGLFLGFLTPGRIGEFIRIFYARRRLAGDTAAATVSVIADRLLDLAALLFFGGSAFLALPSSIYVRGAIGWSFIAIAVIIPLAMIIEGSTALLSNWLKRKKWSIGEIDLERWSSALANLPPMGVLASIALTAIAYGLFFGQGALLAASLGLSLDYFDIAFTMSLSSLIALLPFSISGLGTREWVITIYLGTFGIQPERALAFSALIFLAFNVWGSLLGGISWLVYPEALKASTEATGGDKFKQGPNSLNPTAQLDEFDRW